MIVDYTSHKTSEDLFGVEMENSKKNLSHHQSLHLVGRNTASYKVKTFEVKPTNPPSSISFP